MGNITNYLNNIITAQKGIDTRQSMHDAIKQVYDDAAQSGNANMEVTFARGTENTLNDRLIKMDQVAETTTAQLATTEQNLGDPNEFRPFNPNVITKLSYEARELGFNPKWKGAMADGINDDTLALEKSYEEAFSDGYSVRLPNGIYVYQGDGIDIPAGYNMSLNGRERNKTKVKIADGKYLFTPTANFDSILVQDVTFEGGAGAFKSTYQGINVAGQRIFVRVNFVGYTDAAVSHLNSDSPYWSFQYCVFNAKDLQKSIGVALAGAGVNQNDFLRCDFLNNRYHIKVKGGTDLKIKNCDFLRWTQNRPNPATDIWIVPNPANPYGSGGNGLVIESSKFGNENLVAGDKRIIYAEEDSTSGTDFSNKGADLSNISPGYVYGHTVKDVKIAGNAASNGVPFVYSMAPRYRDNRFENIMFENNDPKYLVEFHPNALPLIGLVNNNNKVRNVGGQTTRSSLAGDMIAISNRPEVFDVDGSDIYQTYGKERTYESVSDSGAAGKLVIQKITEFSLDGTVTKLQSYPDVLDSESSDNACRYSFNGNGGRVRSTFISADLAKPVWIELDLKKSSNNPLSKIRIVVRYTNNGLMHFQRYIDIQSKWKRYRFKWVPIESNHYFDFYIDTEESGEVDIGRVSVYQAYEPMNTNRIKAWSTFEHVGERAGFFGATPKVQPIVTGARADGTALISLLSALNQLGLIKDNTTST